MNQTHRTDAWREANGGFRGSLLLAGGTALLALGALLALVGPLVGGPDTGSRDGVVVAGWLAYILGLGLVGTGFGWSCVAGILPRAGLAVAVTLGSAAHAVSNTKCARACVLSRDARRHPAARADRLSVWHDHPVRTATAR